LAQQDLPHKPVSHSCLVHELTWKAEKTKEEKKLNVFFQKEFLP
jgi:hypothetical protein